MRFLSPLTRRGPFALALSAILLAACATKPEVRTTAAREAGDDTYKTFAFYPQAVGPGGRITYSTPMTNQLMRAARTEMEKLNYIFDENDPDLRVNLIATMVERRDVRGTRVGPGLLGTSYVDSAPYQQGTVVVDLVDAHHNTLVWRGMARGRLDTDALSNPGPTIDTAVAEIFSHIPSDLAGPRGDVAN